MIQTSRGGAVVAQPVGRALNTEYQNGNRWRLVLCSFIASTTGIGASAMVYPSVKSSSGVIQDTQGAGIQSNNVAGVNLSLYFSTQLLVPPKYYYKLVVTLSNGTISLANVISEVDL